jgi:Adenine specific DNA methylase Mod
MIDEQIKPEPKDLPAEDKKKLLDGNSLLSLKEVALLLGVTWQTVRNYIKQGKIEAIKLNDDRDYRITPNQIINFLIRKNSTAACNAVLGADNFQIIKKTKNCVLSYAGKSSIEDILEKTPDVNFNPVVCDHKGFYDSIFQGDNLYILKTLAGEISGMVDLIYIDPPFGTNQDFINYGNVNAYSDKITNDVFLEFIRKRLCFLRNLLSDKGSIYLHIDKKMGHYVKIIMDEIFGEDNYLNEITRIKCNPKNFSRKAYGNISDTIFLYAKKRDLNIWNDVKTPLTGEETEKLFPRIDRDGNRYTTNPLHAPGETRNGPTGEMWKGMYPPRGRHWRYNPEVLTELDENGLIEWSSTGNPRKVIYARDHNGKKVQDVWEFKDKGGTYTDFPTEKNHEMLDMIIRNSSNEGSIVLDAFMGSGATLVEAHRLGRRFIGIDLSSHSIETAEKQFKAGMIRYNLYKSEKKE